MSLSKSTIRKILEDVSHEYRGPGGAIAVVKDRELLDKYTWGYADLDKRDPMTTSTLMPMCSITKQVENIAP